MPQSVDPITTRVHVPPRIPLASIDPTLLSPVLTTFRQGTADVAPKCHCTLDLKLPVEDDDTSATLEARWFIDYDATNFSSIGPVQTNTLPGSLDNVTVREPVVYTVQPDNFSTGVHVIEMVVAEQSGFDETSSTKPNRAVKNAEGYESAVYRFVVNVQPSPQPACPDVQPSRRVCTP